MALSDAGICTIGLQRIGVSDQVNDLEDRTKAGRLAKLFYEPMRDEVLSAYPWSFAMRRVALALLPEAVDLPWTYRYALPSDCLTPRYLDQGVVETLPAARAAFAISERGTVAGGSLRVLQADLADAVLAYTARISTVSLFSPLFVTALSWRLAVEFAMPMAVSPDLRTLAEQRFEFWLARAKVADANGQQDRPAPDSPIEQARL